MVSVMEVMSELCATPAAGSEQAQAARSHEIESPDVFAFADETCRGVAETMATTGVNAMPVVDRSTNLICGQVTLQDLLAGRRRSVQREQDRVRVFGRSR
jgi:CIC family chloride channel protein